MLQLVSKNVRHCLICIYIHVLEAHRNLKYSHYTWDTTYSLWASKTHRYLINSV